MTGPVQLVRRGQIAAIAMMLAAAFAEDPMHRWGLLPDAAGNGAGEAARDEAGAAVFEALLIEYVAVDAVWHVDGLGAAVWLPPAAAASFDELERRTREAIRPFTPDAGASSEQFWDWIAEQLPAEPMWLLDVVGVAPAAQGRGLGRRLIEHGLALAADQGLPAYLETGVARNVSYYEGLGFEVVAQADPPRGWTARLVPAAPLRIAGQPASRPAGQPASASPTTAARRARW